MRLYSKAKALNPLLCQRLHILCKKRQTFKTTTLVQPPLQRSRPCSRIKSPLNTKEAICIVKATCRRLIRARINDCHRRMNYANDKLLLCLSKLKELIPTPPLNTLTTIAEKRPNKTTEQHHAIVQSKLIRLQHAAHKKRHKTDKNWVRNIASRPLDANDTHAFRLRPSTLLRT